MSENDSIYGEANYDSDGGNTNATHLKIKGSSERGKTTHNVFRIAPPLKDQRRSGRIVMYEPVHWGYFGENRRDPTKAVPRTFVCPQEANWSGGVKEVTVPCAECDLISEMYDRREAIVPGYQKFDRAQREAAESRLTAGAKTELAVLNEFLEGREKGAGSHKVDNKKYKINAYSRDEQKAGDLKLSPTVWKQIKASGRDAKDPAKQGLIDKWMAKGYDITSPKQGLWIDIIRTGDGSGRGQPLDRVVELREPDPNDPMSDGRPVKAPIEPGSPMDLAFQGCRDLSDCSPSTRLTPEQVAQLVALYRAGQNSPQAVDAVFSAARAGERANAVQSQVPQDFRTGRDAGLEQVFAPPAAPAPVSALPVAAPPVVTSAPAPSTPASTPPAIAARGEGLDPAQQHLTDFMAQLRANKAAKGGK